jgi:TPR repeat protein
MNQTKKRLHIIKLAISITDIDCIQHQILKLSQLKADKKLQEILEMLNAKHYAQAQERITAYIDTPMDEIIQRTPAQEEPKSTLQKEREDAIIEAFDLFTEPADDEEKISVEDIDLFLGQETPQTKTYDNKVDYDALHSLGADDILADNISIDLSASPREAAYHEEAHMGKIPPDESFFREETRESMTDAKEEDNFFDTELLKEERAPSHKESLSKLLEEENNDTSHHDEVKQQADTELAGSYPPISYIEEKFNHLKVQYPPIEYHPDDEPSVTSLLQKIKTDTYREEEIEQTVSYILELTRKGSKSEAAKLLLIVASTPSLYAQFMLARALFKGDILKKNIPEAFSIIYRLANDENYPEAICDLAQLYEYGIGVQKDLRKAESLYSEAAQMGIERARKHVARIRKENKGFFSRLKK